MSLDNTQRFERRVLLLMALVQFINIWDFMIVMPMGPDFARALGIDAGHIGWIAGSYSLSAAVVGVLSASFLDRFDRRKVLMFTLGGMIVSTLSMLLANTFSQLIFVRVLTGAFGGPVFASSLAIVADVFPPQRRGEAMGKVFGSFSVASVVGVPLGLEIAHHFGWWSPFVAVSGVAAITLAIMFAWLPPMRHHLDNPQANAPSLFGSVRHNKAAILGLLMTAAGMFAAFLIIPNISAHVQQNMGYPRELLGLLYFCGGSAAFFSMRYVGKKSDRIGYANTSLIATIGLLGVLYIGFYAQWHEIPVLALFILFMITMSSRNVLNNTLISRIPKPQERAGFMSLNAAMQNLMAGVGAMCSTALLVETPDHKLAGMDHVALIAMAAFSLSLWFMFQVEKTLKLQRNDRDQSHNTL